MAKKETAKKIAAVEAVAAPDARVIRYMPHANWDPKHVKPLAEGKETSRGKWLAFVKAHNGKTMADLVASVEKHGLPATPKPGSKNGYTIGQWVGWMQTAGVVTLKDA